MLDKGTAIVAILTFAGGIAAALFKLVRWGLRQDMAIFNLQKSDEVKSAKLYEVEQRLQRTEQTVRELEWQGRVFVFPQGQQRRRERQLESQRMRRDEGEPDEG